MICVSSHKSNISPKWVAGGRNRPQHLSLLTSLLHGSAQVGFHFRKGIVAPVLQLHWGWYLGYCTQCITCLSESDHQPPVHYLDLFQIKKVGTCTQVLFISKHGYNRKKWWHNHAFIQKEFRRWPRAVFQPFSNKQIGSHQGCITCILNRGVVGCLVPPRRLHWKQQGGGVSGIFPLTEGG